MASFPIDFDAFHTGALTMQDAADTLTVAQLQQATELSVTRMLAHIADCTDADVRFVALDPDAAEGVTNAEGDVLGWTLRHIIAHTTATAEASIFAAGELARGVVLQGIGRYETPWETLMTIEHCRQRLRESQRMRLASLAAWPSQPHLANRYSPFPGAEPLNAKGIVVLGLEHDATHQHQLAAIARQINTYGHCSIETSY